MFVVSLHSHSALESHSRYRSSKSAGDQGLCSPQKSEMFGGPKKDASHAHRTLIALPSHTRTRVFHKRTWCFLQMQVDKELSFILFTPTRFNPNPLVPAHSQISIQVDMEGKKYGTRFFREHTKNAAPLIEELQ